MQMILKRSEEVWYDTVPYVMNVSNNVRIGGTEFEGPKKFRIRQWDKYCFVHSVLIQHCFLERNRIVPFFTFLLFGKTSDGFSKLNQQLSHVHFELKFFFELKKLKILSLSRLQ
jgi:hypothetical protein